MNDVTKFTNVQLMLIYGHFENTLADRNDMNIRDRHKKLNPPIEVGQAFLDYHKVLEDEMIKRGLK